MEFFEIFIYATVLYSIPLALIAYYDHEHKNQCGELKKQNDELRKALYDLQQRMDDAE